MNRQIGEQLAHKRSLDSFDLIKLKNRVELRLGALGLKAPGLPGTSITRRAEGHDGVRGDISFPQTKAKPAEHGFQQSLGGGVQVNFAAFVFDRDNHRRVAESAKKGMAVVDFRGIRVRRSGLPRRWRPPEPQGARLRRLLFLRKREHRLVHHALGNQSRPRAAGYIEGGLHAELCRRHEGDDQQCDYSKSPNDDY